MDSSSSFETQQNDPAHEEEEEEEELIPMKMVPGQPWVLVGQHLPQMKVLREPRTRVAPNLAHLNEMVPKGSKEDGFQNNFFAMADESERLNFDAYGPLGGF